MPKIRLLLVDDYEVVRRGLKLMLDIEPDLDVVGEAASGRAAIEQATVLQPDVVVLDLRMPGMNGAQAALAIKQVSAQTRVLILSGVNADAEVVAALGSNVDGYVLKDAPSSELLHAIRIIAQGQAYIQPEVAKRLLRHMAATTHPGAVAQPPQLTQREFEVLKLLATNRSNKQIAEALVVSEETVRSHVKRILHKLDQPNRMQAVLAAVRWGLIELT